MRLRGWVTLAGAAIASAAACSAPSGSSDGSGASTDGASNATGAGRASTGGATSATYSNNGGGSQGGATSGSPVTGSSGTSAGKGGASTGAASTGAASTGAASTGGASTVASTGGASSRSSTASGAGSSSTSSGGSSSAANPFGCKFGWGEPAPSGSFSSYSWLQFVTNWAGYEIQADGTLNGFDNGSFLTSAVSANLIPAYYAYIIGYYGHANGLPDQNCCSCGDNCCTTCTASQPNLTTGTAYLLLADPNGANAPCHSTTAFCDQNVVVQAYASYAQQTHQAWPTKPFVWLIEGDFIQYTDTSQVASLTSATGSAAGLTYAQLGQLASLIASAIKTNMPNALVAFDDSAWIDDTTRPLYWQGIMQAGTDFDFVWTTGVGNNVPFLNSGQKASDYDGMTGTYAWLHTTTGKKILVDESAGASQQSDTWSNQPAATLNQLIADGVIGVNVSGAPSDYQSNVSALAPDLASTCP